MNTSAANQNNTSGRVHSAGCVRDGKVICACDVRAARFISRTPQNPGRPFYRCAINKCSFWKWESDLLNAGVIPPQPLSAPETPQRQQQLAFSSTVITPSANNLPISPPQTQSPTKRKHVRMSTGSNMPPGAKEQRSKDLSDEAKARRQTLIDAFMVSDEDRRAAAHEDDGDSDSGEEMERGRYYRESDSSDEEYSGPSTKRLRFAIKKEEVEEGRVLASRDMQSTPPRRTSPGLVSLPTPSQTHERVGSTEEVEEALHYTPPASPTSFTKGAQRALEKARERGNVNNGSLMSKHQSRASGNDVSAEIVRNGGQESAPVSAPVDGTHDRAPAGQSQSFQAQLASFIQKSGSNANTPPSSQPGSSQTRSSPACIALSALSAMAAEQATLETVIHDLIAESERLRRKLTSSEKSNAWKQQHISKLQEENSQLKTKNVELEAVRNQILKCAQSTPPRPKDE